MKTVPNPLAGYTYWLDMELAYPEIHPQLRARWEKRTVVQQNWHNPGHDLIEWPSMKQHPVTGRWSPRCNYHGIADSWILDTKDAAGNSMGTGIVEELMEAMAEVPGCTYEQRWAPNDIVLYDNWPFVHRRTAPNLKEGQERLMWRANVDHDISLASSF
jgi:alpha-ketoglutarate-dependent taurine dioxygenase